MAAASLTADTIAPADGEPQVAQEVRQVLRWLAPTDDPAMLGRIGPYEIAGVVGSGGMGVVVKGYDRALQRFVAIKLLAPHLASSAAARRRFAREAQAAAAVVHDNVVAIHGVDEHDGLPYLVMPYLRGTSLQRRIEQQGALGVTESLRIALQTARGLAAAHDQGLVHRDIKPGNILLDGTTERVLLTDFGLARAADDASLTRSGVIAGTPIFMSPEQAEGAAIDHRSDLFSLGSVLYTMCSGRPPFRAETSWGILRRVCEATPRALREVNPDIPRWLDEIVMRLLQKRPADRFQSATEVADLLEQCLAHRQEPLRRALPQSLRQPASGRTGFRLAIVAAVLAGVSWLFGPQVGTGPGADADNGSTGEVPSASRAETPQTGSMEAAAEVTAPTVVPGWDETQSELQNLARRLRRLEQDVAAGAVDFQEPVNPSEE